MPAPSADTNRLPLCLPTCRLASVVIMIRVTVTPIPVRPLVFHFYFDKGPILSVPLGEVHMVGTVFVVIPIVIVLVVAVVDPVLALIVSVVILLASIVLRLGSGANCRWRSKGCSKKKRTYKILISTVHVIFLRTRDFHLRNLTMRRVSIYVRIEDVRNRTLVSTTQLHSRFGEIPGCEAAKCDSEA
jgi:hypothetical protein